MRNATTLALILWQIFHIVSVTLASNAKWFSLKQACRKKHFIDVNEIGINFKSFINRKALQKKCSRHVRS